MVQGPNFMKIDVICLRRRPEMPKDAINTKITSSTEIFMDKFDQIWKAYTKKVNFFACYNTRHRKQRQALHQLQCWYERVLRSQFSHSSDQHDIISLDHWTIDIGDEEEFIVDNHTVPFHAIIKTPIMEHWYTHANVDNNPNLLLAYVGESRRIPLFDEHKVIQPYYHTNSNCLPLNKCTTFRNCNKMKKMQPICQAILTERKRLAEEVF